MGRGAAKPNQTPVDPQTRLHAELLGLLPQHSRFRDQRHLVLLAQMVTGLLLSQTVCFEPGKTFCRWATASLPAGSGAVSDGWAMAGSMLRSSMGR